MLLDTIPQIINNIKIPEKSNFEIYAPYVAVFVSLLTVVVNIWLNNRQIKNSHAILEKGIAANWKNIAKNNKINFELKLLEEFKDLYHDSYPLMRELMNVTEFEDEFQKSADVLFELFIKQVQVFGRIQVKFKREDAIIGSCFEFHQSLGVKTDEKDYFDKLDILLGTYQNESDMFIAEATKKLLKQ